MHSVSSSGQLCFKEDEFIHSNFNVDKFVASCKDRVSMSTLREDLEMHYKNIQLALIELINRDYADFVSLSSNLIGTEKTIENLNLPLGQLKEEVCSVKGDMSMALSNLEQKLEQRRSIREKKSRLHHLINVVHSVEKIEKILTADPKSPDLEIFMSEDRTHPGHFLERIAGEFNQLQFHVNQSKGHPIIESIRPRVALITSKLQENLEASFEQGIVNKHSELILRCLRTYALIDKTSHAEELFKHIVVKPFVAEVVQESYHNEHGTDTMCKVIIKFVEQECETVLALTSDKAKKSDMVLDNKEQTVKGFDFLVNSVWVELAQAFEERLPLLFSPGNPDLFLQRYKVMMAFLEEFEDHCVSVDSFKNLRKHPSYNSFMIKWSLPVYFQIRFQEIGGKIEVSADSPYVKSPEELFMTNIVGSCWQGIQRCWQDDMYIKPLKGRFWKLNLQIICRLSVFVKSVAQPEEPNPLKSESIETIALLLGDGCYCIKKVKDYYKEVIEKKLQDFGPVDTTLYKEALEEACDMVGGQLEMLNMSLVNKLSNEGSIQLESVKNVPRLYRRTNKDPPSQASSYIPAAFLPLANFKINSSTLDDQRQTRIVDMTVSSMTSRYLTSVDELLTSIKKTEDSLLRLKQQRKAAAGQAGVSPGSKSNEVSDENKIRKQILLDAEEYGNQMEAVGAVARDFPEYIKLKEITKNAMEQTVTVD